MPDPNNPFDINRYNGITFTQAEYAGVAGYSNPGPTTSGPKIDPASFEPSSLKGSLGKIIVVNDTYVAPFSTPAMTGPPRPATYHLPTFGAIQFENIKDGSGNPITFWVHGFSENGLFLTLAKDAFWTGTTASFDSVNGGNLGGYAFGFYGIDLTGTGGPQEITSLIDFNKDPSVLAVTCFAEGTRIETAAGAIAIEDLSIGDEVVTASGEHRPIRWIGQTTARPARHPRPWQVNPVLVTAHAFGFNLPRHDVRLSPGHAVYVDGVLVAIGSLVNGATIVQEEVEQIRYFHVELESHDVLLAEGLPCESYLNDGNRFSFHNLPEFVELYGRLDPQSWEDACAPFVGDGPQLVAIRERIDAQAEALGWRKSEEADLVIEADGASLAPLHRMGDRYWFAVPACEALVIRSNHSVLAHVMPNLEDKRRLGVALSELRIDGVPVDLDAEMFGDGFHPVEARAEMAWRWTDGAGALYLESERAAMLELSCIMIAPTWKRVAPQLRVVA